MKCSVQASQANRNRSAAFTPLHRAIRRAARIENLAPHSVAVLKRRERRAPIMLEKFHAPSLFLLLMLLSTSMRGLDVGIAVSDVTPKKSIWLAGYAGRERASDKVDSTLRATGLALRD